MKYYILLFILILPFCVSGQNYLTARMGLSATNVAAKHSETNLKIGISGGMGYEYLFSKQYSLGADIMFNQFGSTFKFDMRDANGDYAGVVKNKVTCNYLALPIKAGFYIGEKVKGFGKLGVVPAVLLGVKERPSDPVEYRVFRSTEYYKRFDLAVLLELGTMFEIAERFSLFGSFQYQHSFTKYNKIDNMGELRHYGFTLSAGVKRKL